MSDDTRMYLCSGEEVSAVSAASERVSITALLRLGGSAGQNRGQDTLADFCFSSACSWLYLSTERRLS